VPFDLFLVGSRVAGDGDADVRLAAKQVGVGPVVVEDSIATSKETAYAGFVNELNQRIENYRHLLAQRQGRNAKDNEDEGENPGETQQ
jgi:hypothetical protein